MSNDSNLPWEKAIIVTLEKAGLPLHYSVIAERIVQEKLRTRMGATPAQTVNFYLSQSMTQDPTNTPFERVSRGVYRLRNRPPSPSTGETSDPVAGPATPAQAADIAEFEADKKPAGIIRAFGMFWRRDWVDWGSVRPLILGKQQAGAESVDFCDQHGVYLLHDGARVVYVGQVSIQGLGVRLCQHCSDRLNGRWERFSWFGIRPVHDNGKLGEVDLAGVTPADMITTLEALLIEGLEPPQNRRRGDSFNAVEYIQVLSPSIKKRQEREVLRKMSERIGQD